MYIPLCMLHYQRSPLGTFGSTGDWHTNYAKCSERELTSSTVMVFCVPVYRCLNEGRASLHDRHCPRSGTFLYHRNTDQNGSKCRPSIMLVLYVGVTTSCNQPVVINKHPSTCTSHSITIIIVSTWNHLGTT